MTSRIRCIVLQLHFGHVHRLGHLGHSVLFGFKFSPSVFRKNPGYAVAALSLEVGEYITPLEGVGQGGGW